MRRESCLSQKKLEEGLGGPIRRKSQQNCIVSEESKGESARQEKGDKVGEGQRKVRRVGEEREP